MKKILIAAAAILLTLSGAMAQNTFKGVVKYKVESTGVVPIEMPEEVRNAEIKVSGDMMFTKSAIFAGGMTEAILVNGLTSTSCQNFSMYLSYLRSQDFEFTYQGDGKILVKHTYEESEFDSLAIEDKEPGHFYYEYVESETRQICGFTAKKMVRHQYDDEGNDHPMTMWYSDEIGPKLNVLFGGIKGMPLECTIDAGEDRAITYTATEIVKGKVKDIDFLLPSGYETLSDEDLELLGTELHDAIELMSGE